MNVKDKILKSCANIYELSRNSKLEDSVFHALQDDLQEISDYFNVSDSQAFFIGLVFSLTFDQQVPDLSDLVKHLKCNPMKLLSYSDDFEVLYSRGIFRRKRNQFGFSNMEVQDDIVFNQKIVEAILSNKPLPELRTNVFKDEFELLEYIESLFDEVEDRSMLTKEMLVIVKRILKANIKFPLIKTIMHFDLREQDHIVYLHLIWRTLLGNEDINLGRFLENVIDKKGIRARYLQSYFSGSNALLHHDLVKKVESIFANELELELTEKSIRCLKETGLSFAQTTKKRDNIILPADTTPRSLIFNEEEMQQLTLLREMTESSVLSKTMKRLEQRNLPPGITALFHGYPGTGKTESVLQMAKNTGRSIFKVDISSSKSMWFGESEKIIKRIFTDYAEYSKECTYTPVLFFNEADALLSQRRKISQSDVSQTENAIQNILLEELENFKGIFIATTNLITNLDEAFERRFLFKIKFEKPDIKARTEIWKLKMKDKLRKDEYERLAAHYGYSGGEIDNIVRKCEIYEVVQGKNITFKDIIDFCESEILLDKNKQPIGFSKY
ncbi:MAG: ATP-binding protein [Bacteroidales bacterium]|nr:ATP-binding protein [Bacteroidales bacterium]